MIGFDLTPEQKALQEKARRFALEVIQPVAATHDRDGTFPLDVMKKAHGEGFFTPVVPKKYGGQGLGLLDTCLVAEELAAGCMGMYVSIFVSRRKSTPAAPTPPRRRLHRPKNNRASRTMHRRAHLP